MSAVLVTGAGGFVGLALVEALLARGETVTTLDAAPLTEAARACFAALPGRLQPVLADARDAAALQDAMAGADRMIIAAAVTAGPAREMAAPEHILSVNVQAVATAVRLAAAAGLRRVVHLSSGAAYGGADASEPVLVEDAPLRPTALYGISKAAGEAVALRLSALGGLDLVAARLGTCFGPWEHATGLRDTLSPQWQILQAALRGEEAVLPRDSVRDWLYVRDAAAGLLSLLDRPALPHRVYNVGTGITWPLSDFCRSLAAVRPGFAWRVGEPGTIATHTERSAASVARLLADTPFRPSFGAAEAVRDWLAFHAHFPAALHARG
ncbi:MAG: NAD(P)-dependent oxidoreductase [Acetobacteraceae bacterium]